MAIIRAIWRRLANEPTIVNAVVALAATVGLELLEVIEASGGTLATIAALVLAQAGVTRQKVTPV